MKKVVMIAPPFYSIPPNKGAAVEWWIYQVSKRLTQYERHVISIVKENELQLKAMAAGVPVLVAKKGG